MLRRTNRTGFVRRSLAVLVGVAALALLGPGSVSPPAPEESRAATLPSDFQESVVFTGLTNPTVVRFADDGRVFVAEKSGLIKVFDSLSDTTPTTFADLRTNVHNFWDRGLLGLALAPGFPSSPYVYVLYTYDHELGSPSAPPRWGDTCPNPPGATSDGCVVSGRLSRLQAAGNVMTGSEQVLVEDWCQQYPSHSVGTAEFGPDGALYASAGDGASFNFVDYGQDGTPLNPCGDPPGGVGATLTPPSAEGGALRSQDLRTSGDPVSLDGSLIRVNPSTGAAPSNNPLAGNADANARRIIAHGLRNPFRFTFRPGTSELWIGDVGWEDWEEINRILNPTDAIVENFGWPCYEGNPAQSGYGAAGLAVCTSLSPSAVTNPYFAYHHSNKVVSGESCPLGSSSLSGVSFEFAPTGSTFPSDYRGALFFADYSRDCIWVMKKGGSSVPSPGHIETFAAEAANPVNLEFGPDGNLYYADFDGGTIRRIRSVASPPTGTNFGAPTTYPTGSNAHGAALADVNGDGRTDLAVANAGNSTVSILLGNGNGGFASATSLSTGATPKSVTVADLSGDGVLDLATANQSGNTVSVLLGTGNGSFAPATSYPVCTGTHEVSVGNFNGDGRPDLAAACWGGTVISVLLGTGGGSFGSAVNSAAGSAPHSLVARDFNLDGHQDLAVANHDGASVSVLRGNGNGTFQPPVNYAVGAGTHSVRAGDFNSDGSADLVTANDASDSVSVLLGNPTGTFAPAVSYPTGRVPKSVAIGDFNGDGKRDLVTANTAGNYPSGASNPGGDQVSVLLGTGSGSFGPPTNYLAGNTPFSVAVGQIDSDGQPDLATANWFGNNASILLNTTVGPPLSPTTYLSDLGWTSMTNGWGPVEKDISNGEAGVGDGVVITLNGTTYPKGLGAHAASDVRYALGPTCTRFQASIGIDDEVGANGSLTFEVYAGATKVYDSGPMTGATATKNVDISIAGASALRLVVNGGASIDYDHADWALARIECGSGGGDTTPPTITARTPAPGATGVALDASLAATFSEAMDPSTLTTSTFTLVKQGQTTPLPASVSYAGLNATLDPSANLEVSTTYTATVKGGSSGAKDVAGNPLASDVSWTFTSTGQPPAADTYLSDLTWTSMTNGWGPVEKDTSNGEAGAGDGVAITLNGTTYAKGLGTHAASEVRYALGSTCSRFKASVGVDDEVGSIGSVVFEVHAGATKVYDSGLMNGTTATKTIDVSIAGTSELRLVVTNGGDNADYDHGDWALARVECGSGGGDTTPPTIAARTPAPGATGVALDISPTTTFSEAMDPSTLTTSTFTLVEQGQTTPLPASVSYASLTATLDPSANVKASTTYTATVKGGTNGAKDVAGNPLAADVSWSFTTGAGTNQPPVPVIDTPAPTLTWKVGDSISFTGHANDPEQGALPASSLTWTLFIQHCPSNCHPHTVQSWPGLASGSFAAPDHEYPSYLELHLVATDVGGATGTTTVRLDPQTVNLNFSSSPQGLQLSVNASSATTPFARTVIIGSSNSMSASSPQVLGGTTYEFSFWSDGGAPTHNVVASATPVTYTASYVIAPPRNTVLPDISGQPRIGRTLTVSNGTWSGSQPMTFTYQWLRCTSTTIGSCVTIGGATASSYVATAADSRLRLRARVSASNGGGSASVASSATSPVK